jgi:hypothetical protein
MGEDMTLGLFIMRLVWIILQRLPGLKFLRLLKHSSHSHEVITTMCLLILLPQVLVNPTSLCMLNFGVQAVTHTTSIA